MNMPSSTASDFLRHPIDKNVFAINHIRTSAGFTIAIKHIQVWLQESTTEFLVFMNELLDIAHVIPLLLSRECNLPGTTSAEGIAFA